MRHQLPRQEKGPTSTLTSTPTNSQVSTTCIINGTTGGVVVLLVLINYSFVDLTIINECILIKMLASTKTHTPLYVLIVEFVSKFASVVNLLYFFIFFVYVLHHIERRNYIFHGLCRNLRIILLDNLLIL